jgi:hypothetical protein
MNKQILVSSLLLLVTILLPVSAQARDGIFPTLRQEMQQKREEIKNKIEKKHEERQSTGIQNRQNKAQGAINRLRQGIIFRYENTLKHKANIEARIAKIEAIVVPTGKQKGDLAVARAELAKFSNAKYKSDLALFDAKVAEILSSSTPLKLVPEVKTLAKTLSEDIKNMRLTLANTLRLIIKAR